MARVYPRFILASDSFFGIHASRSPGSRVVEAAQRSFQAREREGAQDESLAMVEDGAVVGSAVVLSRVIAEVVEGAAEVVVLAEALDASVLVVVLTLVDDVMATAEAAAARMSSA